MNHFLEREGWKNHIRVAGFSQIRDGFYSLPRSLETKPAYPVGIHRSFSTHEENSFWFRHRNRAIIAALDHCFPEEREWLDVGGGNGTVARALINSGRATVVVEPTWEGAEYAAERGLSVFHGTLAALKLPAESVSALGSFDVLEHVENAEGFLEEIYRVLSPKGALCLTVPAYQLLWSDYDRAVGHFRRYSLGDLLSLLSDFGFTPLYSSYFFSTLVPPLYLMRRIPYLLGRRAFEPKNPSTLPHREISSSLQHAWDLAMSWEIAMLRRGWRIPFGSSLIVCLRKSG